MPADILQQITSGEAEASIPNFEAKKNMFVGLSVFDEKKVSESTKIDLMEQGQMMRGAGFLRVTLAPAREAIRRNICQLHGYSRLASDFEVDRV